MGPSARMLNGSSPPESFDAVEGALEALEDDAALVQDVAEEERESSRSETRSKILKVQHLYLKSIINKL